MSLFNFEVEQDKIDEFSKLLEKSGNIKRGVLMNAIVTRKDSSYIFVDVGIKSEGRIAKEEFFTGVADEVLPEVGDTIAVLLEALEDKNGDVLLSYSKALREAGWSKLEDFYHKRSTVAGTVVRKVQGGCIVNLSGVSAFLPKTHFPIGMKDIKELFGKQHQCYIIKMDRPKSNIIVSLKNSNESEDIVVNFVEGQIVEGIVKTMTDSVCFVDLNGLTARLHVGEISWDRIKEPSDVLKIGDKIKVKIISVSQTNRVSVSLRDLTENPWTLRIKDIGINKGEKYFVKIKNSEENIMFVEFASKIDGRLKLSETAWTKRKQTFDNLRKGSNVEIIVTEIDEKRNKIFVSLKRLTINPVVEFLNNNKIGDEISGEIMQISELGCIVRINENLDGIIPRDECLDSFQIGKIINVFIKNVSIESGHVVLGIIK